MKNLFNLDSEIADTLIERPYPINVGRRQFFFYPPSLGKLILLSRQTQNLGINSENLATNHSLEILRVVREKRDVCCTIIAYHTCKNKEEIASLKIVHERRNLISREASEEDLVTIMLRLLAIDKTEYYMKHLGIDVENDNMRKVVDIKSRTDKNTLTFGGKSLYGSFIYPLLELGMSYNEIVWERSFTNLRLLLADKVNTMYLSDEEMKKVPASIRHKWQDVIKATKDNMSEILSMDWH